MCSNVDGYMTEPVVDRLRTNTQLEHAKQRAKKRREEVKAANILSVLHSQPTTIVPHEAEKTLAPTTATIKIDKHVLHNKQQILRSLQTFEVVKNNENLAQSLRTFEKLVADLCFSPTTPIAENVLSQIESLQDAIYRLESICCAMSKLYLSQANKPHKTNNLPLICFVIVACFVYGIAWFNF